MSGIGSTTSLSTSIRLAPDIGRLGSQLNNLPFIRLSGVDVSGSLQTVLSLSGKFALGMMRFSNTLSESMTIKLTIDGVIIFNDTFTVDASGVVVYGDTTNIVNSSAYADVNSSLLLEAQMATDTSIDFEYVARPVI